MKRYKIVPLQNKESFLAYHLGIPYSASDKLVWVGRAIRNHFGHLDHYDFFDDRGLHYMEFKIPSDLKVGDEIHAGLKGDGISDRLIYFLEDFDDFYLLLKPKEAAL